MDIDISPIDLGDFDPDAIPDAILAALQDELDEISSLWNQVTDGWSNQPRPQTKIGMEGGDLVGISFIEDRRAFWLNFGTRKRHARMGNPYMRKTRPGVLKSRSGGGRRTPVKISKSIDGRSPDTGQSGITARKWDEMIVKIREKKFAAAMDKANAIGALETVK